MREPRYYEDTDITTTRTNETRHERQSHEAQHNVIQNYQPHKSVTVVTMQAYAKEQNYTKCQTGCNPLLKRGCTKLKIMGFNVTSICFMVRQGLNTYSAFYFPSGLQSWYKYVTKHCRFNYALQR